LRRNGGGDSRVNDELFAYVTSKPYAQFGKMRVRTSARLRREYGWFRYASIYWIAAFMPAGRITELPIGLARAPRATPLRYDGPVYFLIGPGTFSSALACAVAVRDFGLGTLVGEATGEPAMTTGEVYSFVLPHSMLGTQLTTKTWMPPKPHPPGEGIRPDIIAPISPSQLARGDDPALDAIRRRLG
jgi:C-terminal processing protease CtpA/Prc